MAEFTKQMNETASEVLGKGKKPRKPWITEEVLKKCENRKECKRKRYDNTDEYNKYREANRDVKKSIREAREKWINGQCLEIEENLTKNSKKAFNTFQHGCHQKVYKQ